MAKTGRRGAPLRRRRCARRRAALLRARESRSSRPSAASSKAPRRPRSRRGTWRYYAEKLRRARYDFDDEALRPYFSLDRVLEGAVRARRRASTASRVEPRRRRRRSGTRASARYRMPRRRTAAVARRLLRRRLPAREQARRRLDGRPHHRRRRRDAADAAPRGPRRGNVTPPARRQARAAHAPRRGDDLPRVRPPAAPPAQPGRGAQPRGHQRGVGLRRAALADHGELVLGARGARPLRAPLRDRRADPRASCSSSMRARAHLPRGQRADAPARLRRRRSGAAHATTTRRARRRHRATARADPRSATRPSPLPEDYAHDRRLHPPVLAARSATPPATTRTSGPRCSTPTPSRASAREGVFSREVGEAFRAEHPGARRQRRSDGALPRASWAASPRSRRCSSATGSWPRGSRRYELQRNLALCPPTAWSDPSPTTAPSG